MRPMSFAVLSIVSALGCGGSGEVQIGTGTAGIYTFDIGREGDPPGAGVATRFVLKPTVGGNPAGITGWVGDATGAGSVKAAAVYDPNDGDFDDNVTCPSPLSADALFYFEVTGTDGTTSVGSIAMK